MGVIPYIILGTITIFILPTSIKHQIINLTIRFRFGVWFIFTRTIILFSLIIIVLSFRVSTSLFGFYCLISIILWIYTMPIIMSCGFVIVISCTIRTSVYYLTKITCAIVKRGLRCVIDSSVVHTASDRTFWVRIEIVVYNGHISAPT